MRRHPISNNERALFKFLNDEAVEKIIESAWNHSYYNSHPIFQNFDRYNYPRLCFTFSIWMVHTLTWSYIQVEFSYEFITSFSQKTLSTCLFGTWRSQLYEIFTTGRRYQRINKNFLQTLTFNLNGTSIMKLGMFDKNGKGRKCII